MNFMVFGPEWVIRERVSIKHREHRPVKTGRATSGASVRNTKVINYHFCFMLFFLNETSENPKRQRQQVHRPKVRRCEKQLFGEPEFGHRRLERRKGRSTSIFNVIIMHCTCTFRLPVCFPLLARGVRCVFFFQQTTRTTKLRHAPNGFTSCPPPSSRAQQVNNILGRVFAFNVTFNFDNKRLVSISETEKKVQDRTRAGYRKKKKLNLPSRQPFHAIHPSPTEKKRNEAQKAFLVLDAFIRECRTGRSLH